MLNHFATNRHDAWKFAGSTPRKPGGPSSVEHPMRPHRVSYRAERLANRPDENGEKKNSFFGEQSLNVIENTGDSDQNGLRLRVVWYGSNVTDNKGT
jgi:hypothetical protein